MDGTAIEPSAGRSRSFGGCATVRCTIGCCRRLANMEQCRNRHTRCDEERPVCRTCRNNGIPCGGYEKAIFFDFEGAPEPGTLRFRRPLLTEKERRLMSEYLTTAVPSRLINQNLSQIDEECEESIASSDLQITRGPFGAFRVGQNILTPRSSSPPSHSVKVSVNSLGPSQESGELICTTGTTFSPSIQEWFDVMLELPSFDANNFLLDMPEYCLDSNRIQEIDNPTSLPELQASDYQLNVESFQIHRFPSDATNDYPMECVQGLVTTTGVTVPHDAVLLLKHYQTGVLQLLTPFRHSKTPWHVLFVPQAKSCLAALTLGEIMNSASLCLFYGVLAISAFSMGGLSQSSMWLDQARRYKQQARESGKSMLQTAYNIPKMEKYKSILMALLTLV